MTEIPMTGRFEDRTPADQEHRTSIAGDMEDAAPLRGMSIIKLLWLLVLLLSLAVLCSIGFSGLIAWKSVDQHTRLDSLETQTNQQQIEIDQLRVQLAQLEHRVGSPP